jgi:ADP-ribosylglycohydrolase
VPAIERASLALGVDLEALDAELEGFEGTERETDRLVSQRAFGLACYIHDSLPLALYFARRHIRGAASREGRPAGGFETALLANTNAGGENCHRGSTLGAIVGAALGMESVPSRLREGLDASRAIESEIDAFLDAVLGGASGAVEL